jgi:hypothetical protein
VIWLYLLIVLGYFLLLKPLYNELLFLNLTSG